MNIAYVRVSTIEQNEARQVEALRVHQIDKWFKEKVSGKDTNRPQLQAMLEFAREGDTIYIHDFSRLARSTSDLLKLVETLQTKNIRLVSNKENIDTHTPTGKLMLTMIAAINEFERMNLLERQREGIAIAKRKGIYKGRKPVAILPEEWQTTYTNYCARKITKVQMAKRLGTMMNAVVFPVRSHRLSWSTTGEPLSLQNLLDCPMMDGGTLTRKPTGIILRWMPTIRPARLCRIFRTVIVSK